MTNPLALRQFDPDFFASFQKRLVVHLGLAGTDDLPAVFKLPVAVALVENTADQLCQKHGIRADEERAKHLVAAIQGYKRCVQYHHAMLKGEARYDLDMRPAGEITEAEREDWRRRFEHLKHQQKIGNKKAQMNMGLRQFSRL